MTPIRQDALVQTRILQSQGVGPVSRTDDLPPPDGNGGWVWVDVLLERGDSQDLHALIAELELDPVAVRDAVEDIDLPKLDDFGNHLLVVLHGLREDRIATYEVDCFMTPRHLVTVHADPSRALDAVFSQLEQGPDLSVLAADELLARIADVLTRRLVSVLDAFDGIAEGLVERALDADPDLLSEWMAVRRDVAATRRIVHPQRETLDLLRHSDSRLITDVGRRRFSDAFDVASRAASGLDAARSELAEILDAYRGAEARRATDVTKVLTVYAAIMLPLSLLTSYFGMNFANLPWIESEAGWIAITVGMLLIAAVSLGVFIAVGWIRRPSGRRAGAALGLGLVEAARAPVQIVGAAYEISTMPVRSAVTRRTKDIGERDTPGAQGTPGPR